MANNNDIYYIPTDLDYEVNPSTYSTMFGTKATVYSTANMPIEPVNPSVVSKLTLKYLKRYGNVICDEAREQIEGFAKLFNACIYFNKNKHNLRLVHPAQTGSAKSLTLKVYISQLKNYSSIVVVSKIDEALSYCETINEYSNDPDYARCYYSITDKNKDNPLRVSKETLKDYRCIIISHAMFQVRNLNNTIGIFKLFKGKQRDLVVIDEKMNFYETIEVSKNQLSKLHDTLFGFLKSSDLDIQEFLGILTFLLFIMQTIRDIQEKNTDDSYAHFNRFDLSYLKKAHPDISAELDKITLLAKSKLDNIKEQINNLGNIKSDRLIHAVLSNVEEIVNKLKQLLVLEDDFTCSTYLFNANYDQTLFSVKNIVNQLGASVILDATASVNEFYKVAYIHSNSIINVQAKQIRSYTNLTIYKAKGFRQGRNSIYRTINKEELTFNSKMYISYALSILSKKSDKLLIISHKGFKLSLQKQCKDERIVFTHWGDHIGKNDWSDCNKVMLIGWNFLSEKEYVFSAFNAIDDEQISSNGITKEVVDNFKTTQVADDIIQALMRSQARKIATKDGDCKKSEVYLFYEDIKLYNNVLNLVVEQLPNCKVVEWTPVGIAKKVKKTKRNKNADLIIGYLQQLEANNSDVMMKTVAKELEFKPYQITRITQSEYFKEELSKKGYILKNSNGKSKYFILK